MRQKTKKIAKKPTINDYILSFEQTADQAWQEGYAGLQDISLVLVETLRNMTENDLQNAGFLSITTEWPNLVEAYKAKSPSATQDIIEFLHNPELNLPLENSEIEMIAEQLRSEAKPIIAESSTKADVDNDQPDLQSIENYCLHFAQLADQAAQANFFGLQDACLLLSDLLEPLPIDQVASLTSTLSSLPDLVESYRCEPKKITAELLQLLKEPILGTPLAEDEFHMLESSLLEHVTEAGTGLERENYEADSQQPDVNPVINSDQKTINPGMLTPDAQQILIMMVSQADMISGVMNEIQLESPAQALDNLLKIGELLQYFGLAAETAGFTALSSICNQVVSNINHYSTDSENFNEDQLSLLRDWIETVKEYLLDITDTNAGQQLVFSVCDSNWALPLPMEEAAEILTKIRSEGTDVKSYEEAVTRKTTAEPEDVSLELPGDVNQELLELLLQELPIQTQQFSEAVQRMQTGGTTEDVQLAQRIAHTLKGSANTVGIKGIAELTHNLEDILTACSREERMPNKPLAATLINASDCLEGMSESLLGIGEPPAEAQNVLQEVLNWANRIDKEGVPPADETMADVQTSTALDAGVQTKAAQSPASMVRVASDQIENLFRLSGENIILNGQAQESIRRMRNQIRSMQIQFALLQDLGNELERLIDLRDLSGRVFGASDSGFDALEMDQYNELHTVSRRMAESAVDAREISADISKELDGMNEVLGFQQGLAIDAQEIVMQTRLVPISTIVPRLQRSLRQTCRLTGKECNLKVSGENILIDGDTLNAMVDPLMHILRNAVDHGIESLDERRAMGKPDYGLIRFEFDRDGNNILLRCRDDGSGLDYGAIRAAAEKRGVLEPGQEATEEDLKKFILRPNFSTRTLTTQTSGRGVGMDVVRAQIINMGGTLILDSVQGHGLTIELRIPLPLSLTYALITNVARYRVAIANKGITQIIYSAEGDLVELDGKEVLRIQENVYPAEHLDKLLGASTEYPVERLNDILHVTDKRKSGRSYSSVLLVQNDDKVTAVLIGPIMDSMDVVIKGMGQYVGKIPGFIGATILGDGTVTPVLDIPELLRLPARERQDFFAEPVDVAQTTSNLPVVLVVDDSLSQRRALEQLLTDAGFRVRTARDGIEAAEMLTSFKPDIVLTDLEMPRMNGIELAAHIRTQDRIKSLPVIMITSRTTQKHKLMAQEAGIDFYLTKPVRDEDLMVKMNELLEQAAKREKTMV